MFWSRRASLHELSRLCFRLGHAIDAGVDIRIACRREAEMAPSAVLRSEMSQVAQMVAEGKPLFEALRTCDQFFPPIFIELVRVGELAGKLPEILLELARHYDEQLQRRRLFLSLASGPLIELVLALSVIGLLIWILGIIGDPYNPVVDPLGFGVVGTPGLVLYLVILSLAAGCIAGLFWAIRSGIEWVRPLQKLTLKLPVLGSALETLQLSRLSWSMAITFSTGMDVREAIRLSLSSTNHGHYLDHIRPIIASVERGESLYEAFAATGGYPTYFLDVLQSGEQSGRLAESMEHLSKQLKDQVAQSLRVLTVAAGWAIWVLIAAIIIFFIFRLASFYIGNISSNLPV